MTLHDDGLSQSKPPTSRSSTPHNVPNAALIASSRAFATKSQSPKTPVQSGIGTNGALSAAKSVNSGSSTPTRRPSSASGVTTPDRDFDDRRVVKKKKKDTTVRPASGVRVDSASSLSFLAANSATSSRPRLPSPLRAVDNWTSVSEERDMESTVWDPETRTLRKIVREVKMGDELRPRRRRSQSMEGLTDGTPIAPTTSLVKLFESQTLTGGMKPVVKKKPDAVKGLGRGKSMPPIVSPKPQRKIPLHSVSPELERPILKPSPKRMSTITTEPMKTENKVRPIPLRKPSIPSKPTIPSSTPILPPPRRPRTKNPDYADIISSSVGSSPQPKLRIPSNNQLQPPIPSLRHDLPSNPKRPSPGPYKDTYIKSISPHITGDSLANAMVGANLALKNSPPRSRTPPPLPAPRRNPKNHDHHPFHLRARSLSPQKKQPMITKTLRRDRTGDSEKEVKGHKFRHPHKHNEATRVRWQDKVNEDDLKRYEGVWASNKGIFIQDPAGANEVAGLVVREIWGRSGIPLQRLVRIWELVGGGVGGNGRPGIGMGNQKASLTREQFVVGMYFIDMVLKGRNLPQSVSESVWDSVRPVGVSVAIRNTKK